VYCTWRGETALASKEVGRAGAAYKERARKNRKTRNMEGFTVLGSFHLKAFRKIGQTGGYSGRKKGEQEPEKILEGAAAIILALLLLSTEESTNRHRDSHAFTRLGKMGGHS